MESINKETVFVFVKLLRPGIKVAKAVVDENGFLKGLITIKDIKKRIEYPNSNKDDFEDYSLVQLSVLVRWIEQKHL